MSLSKSNNRLFIHIGLPKTASSFLQQKVFPFMDQVGYVGMPFVELNHAFNHLKYMVDGELDLDEIKDALILLQYGRKILSDELLSGFLSASCLNRSIVAHRLAHIFPDATIILFLRGQPDIVYSVYKQWITGCNGVDDIQRYVWKPAHDYRYEDYVKNVQIESLDYYRPYYNLYSPALHLDNFFYFELLQLYKSLFERVEVFLFEDFKQSPAVTIARLEEIIERPVIKEHAIEMDKPVNPGLTDEELPERIFKNKILLLPELPFLAENGDDLYRRYGKKETCDREYVNAVTDGYYTKNNRKVIDAYPELNLQNYPAAYMQ